MNSELEEKVTEPEDKVTEPAEEIVAEDSVTEESAMEGSVAEDSATEDSVTEEGKAEESETQENEETETQDESSAPATENDDNEQEPQADPTVKKRWQAFGQNLSIGHVVALMICVLLILMASSFMIEAFRPMPEPEQETTEEEEQPRVIVLGCVPSGYIPTIPEVNTEVSAHANYETMLTDLKCWVKEFGRINIREDSNTDSRVIGYVVYGDLLSMYGTEGDFTKVKYTDHQTGEPAYGYCYSAFLSKEEPDSAKLYLSVPLYKQADPRWGSKMIGGYETLASAGCTTTCISMVESYVHSKDIYPNMMADKLPYTYDGLLTFPGRYSRYAGSDYLQVILKFLHSGIPCLVSGYTSDGRTHWVVVVGYNGNGIDMNPADFVINDPGANRSTLADFFRNYPLFEKIVYYTG